MVEDKDRRVARDADDVQDVGVPGLQRPGSRRRQGARGERVLQLGPIRFHNAHVASGRRFDPRCGLCGGSVEAVAPFVGEEKPPVQEDGVDEVPAVDAAGGGPPARGFWDRVFDEAGDRT